MADEIERLNNASTLRERLNQRLHALNTPISTLPVAGYTRPGQRQQRPAAVLAAFLTVPVPQILLTVRASHLAKHPGQSAFPGGARDAEDRGVVDTALREAEEETGIRRSMIEPLGLLGRYDTITGYRMTAVVGLIEQTVEFEPDHSEVDEVFCVPLTQVIDPSEYKHESVHYREQDYHLLTLSHPRHRIWGATAALLYQLGRLLTPDQDWLEAHF